MPAAKRIWGHWVNGGAEQFASLAHAERVLRLRAEAGEDPVLRVWFHAPPRPDDLADEVWRLSPRSARGRGLVRKRRGT